MIKLSHIITNLDTGGAQMMLYKLVSRLRRDLFDCEVISLKANGVMGSQIQASGIPVWTLGMHHGVANSLAIARLARHLRQNPPDLIQTWMYHSDLIGGLAAKLAGGIPVVWGLRNGTAVAANKLHTRWAVWLSARLSTKLASGLVSCSEAALAAHQAIGYRVASSTIIPNGFDLEEFRPRFRARAEVRRDLGLPEDMVLIGFVGRYDPQKDLATFFAAAELLHKQFADVHFVLCGNGITWENPALGKMILRANLGQQVHLLGRRDDIARLDSSLDIVTLSSRGEAFPNAIGEAMACGVPCVVTDVGDSAAIVGDTGRVVPVKNPEALAAAWTELICLGLEGRRRLGLAARRRIQERYDLAAVVTQYEEFYLKLVGAVQL